jgi:uncharacterized protein (DUF433 family)
MNPTVQPAATRQPVPQSHIWLDERGRAWVDDTNTKVIEIVLDRVAYGWTAEEMHENHPYLSMAQLHAALSYYYDHKDEIDAEIQRMSREFEEMRSQDGESPFQKRMRESGRLP